MKYFTGALVIAALLG